MRLKTMAAARHLGSNYNQLIGLLRYGKMQPPEKDSSGDYVWSEADLERRREALSKLQRRGPKVPAAVAG